MNEIWTILDAHGVEKTLAEWGIEDVARTDRNQAADEVTFNSTVDRADANALFPEGDWITVKRNGVRWFYGRVMEIPRSISGLSEGIAYQLLGPWFHLDDLSCAQKARVWDPAANGGAGAEVDSFTTHIYLGFKQDGTRHTVRSQLEEILRYVNGEGTPNTKIIIAENEYPGVDLYIPHDEVVDMTCSGAIRKQLAYVRDATTWFDYATTPPTLHIKRRNDKPVLTVPITDPLEAMNIRERKELQRTGVVLKFEQTNSVNGNQYTQLGMDRVPNTAEVNQPGVFACTIILAGSNVTTVTATTKCIPHYFAYDDVGHTETANQARLAWWKQRVPWLNNSNISNIWVEPGVVVPQITGQTPPSPSALPMELIDGTVCSWMTGITAVKANAKAQIKYMLNTGTIKTETVTTQVNMTNALDGVRNYSAVSSVTPGENLAPGLAQVMWDALSVRQFSGTVTLHEQEVGDYVTPFLATRTDGKEIMGSNLNIVNGRPEWNLMFSLIQQVRYVVATGVTTITFGPADHLGVQDLVELLRVNRNRRPWTNPATQRNATVSGNTVAMPTTTPAQDTSFGGAAHQSFAVEMANQLGFVKMDVGFNSGTNNCSPVFQMTPDPWNETRLFKLDCADMADSLGRFHPIKIQEIPICIGNTQMYFMGPRSDYFTKP